MNWKWKVLSVVGIIALIVGLLLIIKWQRDIINRQNVIEKSLVELKKLPGEITRSESQYATKDDLNLIAKELGLKLDPIKKDLKTLNAEIKGIQTVKVITPGKISDNLSSDRVEPRPPDDIIIEVPENTDKFGYMKNAQVLKLEEDFSDGKKVPWGEAKFSAWREKPWDLKVYPRNYSAVNVLGQDENGRHYTYSRFSIESEGKRYDINITNSKFIEEYPNSKFRWNPNLMLGVGFGTYLNKPSLAAIPSLQLFLFSYGRTKVLPTWTFVGLGPGYEINNDVWTLMFSPALYNVGDVLPLVRNIYIGPSIGLGTNGIFNLTGGVHVNL